MNDLERALEHVRPTIEAENFRRNLRRELLNREASSVGQTRNSLLWPLLVTSTLAVGFACVLVLFVVRPQVPAQLHTVVMGEPVPTVPEQNRLPSVMPSNQNPVQYVSDSKDPYLRQLLTDQRLSVESDKAFVRDLMYQDLPEYQGDLQPVGGDSYLTLRQYRTPDGKRVMVYTPLIRNSQKTY